MGLVFLLCLFCERSVCLGQLFGSCTSNLPSPGELFFYLCCVLCSDIGFGKSGLNVILLFLEFCCL